MVSTKWLMGTLAAGCVAWSSLGAFAQDKKDDKPKADVKKDVQDAVKDAAKKATDKPAAGGAPDEAAMMANMEAMGKLGDNHKMLADNMVGDWTYENKMWMDPSAPPEVSTGVTNIKAVMGGRYFVSEHKGKFQMPGPDGKMQDMQFEGTSVTGYDNVKQKFVSTWIDNFSTGIMISEGTYDAASKTFTYRGDCPDPAQNNKIVNIRMTIKIVDKDKHVMEWYQPMGGKEAKTMEITYTRKK